MSGKEIFQENLKEWLESIPDYMQQISDLIQKARLDGEEIAFDEDAKEHLSEPKNWELEWLDSEFSLEELEVEDDPGRPGHKWIPFDEGHIETEEVEKLKALGYEECNQYCFTPKDEDLGEHYRIELYTSPVDDQFIAWGIIED